MSKNDETLVILFSQTLDKYQNLVPLVCVSFIKLKLKFIIF